MCARRRPGDNAEERRQDLPPHRAGCECGGEREGGRKGEEDSYVYVRPLVLPSQIHEANIGRKNGVEEVKDPPPPPPPPTILFHSFFPSPR